MSWKLRVLVPALLLAPQAALALGLGDIRLSSSLNEPLAAEIDLVAATPEEVSALQAKLASRDLFQRYGLDRPQYLDTLQFRVGKSRDGRSVLLVRSSAAITEPFVTFLVEATWSSGRLLREYTLLLDPPVYEPGGPAKAAAAPAVSAPVVAATAAPARPEPAPAPAAPSPAVAPPSAPGERPASVTVERNDTLYGIASRFASGHAARNQLAVALYRANPQAFGGNINRLMAGAELRIPDADAVSAVTPGEAAREIADQTAAWRSTTESAARLRLVTPQESGTPAAPAAAAAAAPSDDVRRLEQELAETRRLLELKNQELADLQRHAAERAAEAPVAPQDDTGAGRTAAPAPETAPAPAAAEKAKPPKKPRMPPPVPQEPGLLDSLTSNWTWLLGAAAAVLGGLLAFGWVRRRREEEEGESLAAFTPPTPQPSPPPPSADDTTRLRNYQPPPRSGVVVEEQRAPAPAQWSAPAAPPAPAARLDDTISAEGPLNLDQTTDPLAEADFHMAYGLYDQAADLITLALEREPGRRDLKLKLLDIFFVWGNKQRFLETARELHAKRADGAPGEWDRVAIMGRQIAPGEEMFAAAPTAAAAGSGVIDLNLGTSDSKVDIDVFAPPAAAGGGAVDLDLGDALGGTDPSADTGRNDELDFDVDLSDVTADGEAPTIEMPTAGSGGTITVDVLGPNAPTVQQPRLRDAALPTDSTTALAPEDLGVDLAELRALVDAPPIAAAPAAAASSGRAVPLEPTRVQPKFDPATTAEMPMLSMSNVMEGFDLQAGAPGIDETQAIRNEATGILDLDVGGSMQDNQAATERLSLDDFTAVDLEPVTMSEVGTKLDLARAYIDMGDPDGARSILQEVLAEGSSSQKQEAQRLLGSLPGNG